jgi:excisionase family DNA binding protein
MTTKHDSLGQDRSTSPEPRRRHGHDRGEDATTSRTAHTLSDICASLTAEWDTIASRPPARRTCQSWAQRCAALGGFGSPAEVVATINRLGDPVTSCALLSDLLVLAAEDRLARRAVLQAVLPGLHQVARRRWRRASPRGPWGSQHEVLVDSVGSGWHMITIHSGRRYERPSAVIMRGVEGQLRRTHDRWRTESSNTLALSNLVVEPCDPAWSPEAQAIEFIAAAARAGILTRTEAAILTMSGVLGHPVVQAARALDLPPGHARQSLIQAQARLRRWLRDPPEEQDTTLLPLPQPRTWYPATFEPIGDLLPAFSSAHQLTKDLAMSPLLLRPTAAARLLDVSRSKLYELINAGEINTVTIGSSRRIIYDDLLAFVQRLQNHRLMAVSGVQQTLSSENWSRRRRGNSLATRGAATKTSTSRQRVVAADDGIAANVSGSGGQHG